MEFINSSALIWLAAIAIPILLHLFQKEKPKKTQIPTVQFIQLALKQNSTSRKLHSSLLLLLRILLLALCILLIAQPYFNEPQNENQQSSAIVILIDDSYYTQQAQQLEHIRLKINQFLDSIPEGSEILLLSQSQQVNDFSQIKQEIKTQLDLISPQNSITNFHELISRAQAIGQEKQLVLHAFTDLNKAAWDNHYEIDPALDLTIHRVKPRHGNSLIESVKTFNNNEFIKDSPIQFQVKLSGDLPLAGNSISLSVNDSLIEQKKLSSKVKNESVVEFTFTPKSLDKHELVIRLKRDDALEVDNIWFMAFKPQAKHKILILSDSPSSLVPMKHIIPYALNPQGLELYDFTHANYQDSDTVDWELYESIVLTGSLDLGRKLWDQVAHHLTRGRNFILWPETGEFINSWNKEINPLLADNAILKNTKSALKFTHPNKLKGFANEFEYSLSSTNLDKTIHLGPQAKGTVIIDQNICLINESQAGSIIFCGLPINEELLNAEYFAPLIKQIINLSLGKLSNKLNIFVNEALNSTNNWRKPFEISLPDGFKYSVEPTKHPEFSFSETQQVGFYKSDQINELLFAVNLKRDVRSLSYPEKQAMDKVLQNTQSMHRELSPFLNRRSISSLLVLLILIFNIYELSLSNPKEQGHA